MNVITALVRLLIERSPDAVLDAVEEYVYLIDFIPEDRLKEWAWSNDFYEREGDR